MSKQTILLEFDRWDCDRLSLLLTENGLSDCCEIIKKMKITGREFLELTEIKLLAWRNFSPKFRKNALITLIEDVKKNPEKYIQKSSIPRRTVSSEKPNNLATKLKHLEVSRKNGRTDNATFNKGSPKNIERSPKNVGVRKISTDSKIGSDRPKIGSRDSSKSPSNSKININSRSPNRFNKDSTDTNFYNRNPNKINTSVTKGSNTNKISQNTNNRGKNNANIQAKTQIKYNQKSSSDEWEEETIGTRSNQSPLNKPSQNINNTRNNNARMQTKTQIKYNQKSRHTSSDESEEEIKSTRKNQLPGQQHLNKSSQNTNNRSKNKASQVATQIKYNQKSSSDEWEEETVGTRSNQSPLNKTSQNINITRNNNARMQTKIQIKYNQKSSSDEWEEETVGTRSSQPPLNKPSQNINITRNNNARMQTKTQIKYNQKSRHTSSDESEEEIADTGTNKLPDHCPLNKSFLHDISSVLEELSKKQPPSILQKSKVQIPANLLHKDAMKNQIQSGKNNSTDTEDDEEVEDIYEALSDDEEFDEPIYEDPSHKNNSESDEDEEPIYENPPWKENGSSGMHYQNVSSTPPPLPAKLQNFDTITRKNEKMNQDSKNSNTDVGLPITKMKKIFTWGKRNKNENSSAELINKSETNRVSVNQPTEADGCFMILNPFSGRKSSLPIINNQTKKLPEPPASIPKLNLSTFDSETSLSSGFSEESLNQACNRKISAPSMLSLPGSAPKQAPIEQHNAFHDIDRAEATTILKTLPDGNYLFRPSSKKGNACVLSVVCRSTVYHLAVLSQENGRLSFGSDEDFEDLRAIIHFYKKQSLKLLYDGDAIGTVSLTKGINARKKLN